MTDKEIKNLLTSYVRAEMSLIDGKGLTKQDYTYSKSYNKKIRRMFWSEKYFGSRLHVGYMVRRIAIITIIILGLMVTNEVSARVFGVNLRKYTTSFLTGSKMDVKTYVDSEEHSVSPTETTLPAITRDVPLGIPDGFEQTALNQYNTILYIEWNKKEKEYLQYWREELSSTTNTSVAMDGEYQTIEKIMIYDFAGNYCEKEAKTWIIWQDATYSHTIIATSAKNSKELLIKMAESLYK